MASVPLPRLAPAEALGSADERVPSSPVAPSTRIASPLPGSLGSAAERISPPLSSPPPVEDHRIERLEAEIASLRADLESLRRELGA